MTASVIVGAMVVCVAFLMGWCARTFQFILDRDCCDPDHPRRFPR